MKVPDKMIEEIVDENPGAVDDFMAGNGDSINYLIGIVLKRTGGTVDPSEAEDRLREYLENRVVEVELPYSGDYTFGEKVEEIDGITDTDEAYSMFKYSPNVRVTFEWNKDAETLEPKSVEIDGESYDIQ